MLLPPLETLDLPQNHYHLWPAWLCWQQFDGMEADVKFGLAGFNDQTKCLAQVYTQMQ